MVLFHETDVMILNLKFSKLIMLKLLFFLFMNFSFVNSVYFTMSNISFSLPGDKSKFPPSNHPLLLLYALPKNQYLTNSNKLWYNVTDDKGYLQMYHSTGDLMLRKEFFLNKFTDGDVISATAYVEDSKTGENNSTQIKIYISSMPSLECDLIIADLCFWKSINFYIFENTKPSLIGSLSPIILQDMCKGYQINYTLTRGGDQFRLEPPSTFNKLWTLHTDEPLERDIIRIPFSEKSSDVGELRYVSVKCYLETPEKIFFDYSKDFYVKVLDENDNPPIIHSQKNIDIILKSNFVRKDEIVEIKEVLVTDRDSAAVNNYEITILKDNLCILEENCMIYEDDRDSESQTAIHCRLRFTKDSLINQFPYHVIILFNDTTLLPGYGKQEAEIGLTFHYKENIHQYSEEEYDLTLNQEDLQIPLLLYNSRNVKIFRTAAPLARVAQPDDGRLKTLNTSLTYFSIKNDSSNGGFNVTPKFGIVFVENIFLIRNISSPARLEVQWFNKTSYYSDILLIFLVDEPKVTCSSHSNKIRDWKFCAKNKTPKDCSKTCGLSTGGSSSVEIRAWYGSERCMWRGDRMPGKSTTYLYSTCTPDIKTCPDSKCDELESLDPLICPQDCSEDIVIPSKRNPKTHKGFEIGEGVCFCTKTSQCSCINPPDEKKKKKLVSEDEYLNQNFSNKNSSFVQPRMSRNKNSSVFHSASSCGSFCIFGIFSALIFLSVSIGIVVYCWRNSNRRILKRHRITNESQNFSIPATSEQIDHTDNNLLNLDFTSVFVSNPTINLNRNIEVDPEWEFQRDKLIIEQVLGEGEFGRVLRAKALNIADNEGYTTVAVKTLKDDAGERELADLLSEYRLLKEVCHPNVIRLLGASTSPGGPIYLIIEFAEYGSLRSYLRKCRQIKTEPNIRASTGEQWTEQYDEPKIYSVNARDIISFAWQIAKGMAYLSEMKLVHRDLAARNVLLAAEKVCKVSDFGLTRDVYEDDAYLKKSKGRVPVKWMAPESLSDQVYTNKSDVWSFGVLIWELVTLGASPYPGIAIQSLFHLLCSGYRMERPENCSPDLYCVVRNCWEFDPEKRPNFFELANLFEKMLSEEVEYLDVSGNTVYNRSYFLNHAESQQSKEHDCLNGNLQNYGYSEQKNVQLMIKYPESDNSTINDKKSMILTAELQPLKKKISNEGYEIPIKQSDKMLTNQTVKSDIPRYGYTEMTILNKDF